MVDPNGWRSLCPFPLNLLPWPAHSKIPAITKALETKVGYIGAMGSRRTHRERTQRLIDAGASVEDLSERVMGPIGLDIAARTPEETAISICAEIISKRTGRSAKSLSETDGAIHDRT